MVYAARRIIVKNGNSLTIAFPRLALLGMHLLQGDTVTLQFDTDTETLTVRPLIRRARGEQEPPRRLGMIEVHP